MVTLFCLLILWQYMFESLFNGLLQTFIRLFAIMPDCYYLNIQIIMELWGINTNKLNNHGTMMNEYIWNRYFMRTISLFDSNIMTNSSIFSTGDNTKYTDTLIIHSMHIKSKDLYLIHNVYLKLIIYSSEIFFYGNVFFLFQQFL